MIDDETRDLLRSSLRQLFAEPSDQPLVARLAELGWDEVLEDDAAAAQLLFEAKGAACAPGDALGPFLARQVADAAGRPELADAVVVVAPGLATSMPMPGSVLLVPEADGRLAILTAPFSGTAVRGTDPDLGLIRLEGATPPASAERLPRDVWEAALAAGRWAVSAELVGLAHHVVATAVAYTGERMQYGKPIGVFQALQHRLASAHASVVGAGEVVAEAAASASPWVAVVAKAAAGRAAEQACAQAQQCYGAIGFTWEHEHHRYLRRTYSLDWLLGDWRSLERELGRSLLSQGSAPPVGSL